MKIKEVQGIICLLIFFLFSTQAWPANILNYDSDQTVEGADLSLRQDSWQERFQWPLFGQQAVDISQG